MSTKKEFSVTITGFKTLEQAQAFASWYEGQGEQDASNWFECQEDLDMKSALTDMRAGTTITVGGNVTMRVTAR